MRAVIIERTLWSVALLGIAVAVLGRTALETTVVLPSPLPPTAAEPHRLAADSIDRAAAYTAASDPFRLSRKPATVAYSPALEGVAPPAIVRPPRPTFVLRGIVGGPPWSAIIEGIPGRDGSTLLRQGDTVATFLVRTVGRDTVIIKGADTTWRLTVTRSR